MFPLRLWPSRCPDLIRLVFPIKWSVGSPSCSKHSWRTKQWDTNDICCFRCVWWQRGDYLESTIILPAQQIGTAVAPWPSAITSVDDMAHKGKGKGNMLIPSSQHSIGRCSVVPSAIYVNHTHYSMSSSSFSLRISSLRWWLSAATRICLGCGVFLFSTQNRTSILGVFCVQEILSMGSKVQLSLLYRRTEKQAICVLSSKLNSILYEILIWVFKICLPMCWYAPQSNMLSNLKTR